MFTINIRRPTKGQWEVTANVGGEVVVSTGPTMRIALLGVEAAWFQKKEELANLKSAGL